MATVSQAKQRKKLEVGARIGKHLRVQNVLGQGGAAIVYEALHTRLDAMVAVKVIDVAESLVAEAVMRLEREARVCAQIEDPRVPRVFDVGELDDGRPYLVMERVYGETLEDMLRRGPLEPYFALEITRELLSALSAVHRVGVVHRDIKPSNVIVRVDDRGALHVRLMDFGVSTTMSSGKVQPVITYEGAIIGTPLYMAPEQLSDEALDARTDLYAVGVILYEMLTGTAAFAAQSTAEVMARVLRHDFIPLEQQWPSVPAALAALQRRALSQRPADRFASSEEMHEAIVDILSSTYRPRSVRASLPSRKPGPNPWALATASFVCVAALLVAVPMLMSRDPETPDRVQVGASTLPNASQKERRPTTAEKPLAPVLHERFPHIKQIEVTTIAASAPSSDERADEVDTAREPKQMHVATHRSVNEPTKPAIDMNQYLRELDALRSSLESAAPLERGNVEVDRSEAEDGIPANPFET